MKPYYDDGNGIQIYHGSCEDLFCCISVDSLVTDPPYPNHEKYGWKVPHLASWPSEVTQLHGFVFWDASDFPISFTARHIWSKANRNIGSFGEQYEQFFEINGSSTGRVFRHAVIDSEMNATLNGDVYADHPCQKPIRLMKRVVSMTSGVVFDPFMGSGTTLVAAKQLGRKAIGIELEEKYCEIAARRLSQQVLDFAPKPKPAPVQASILDRIAKP